MSDLKIKVTAGSVSLFLTLSPKLREKHLDKCVILPFIKAYNKKTGDSESLETIMACTLSGSAADGPVSLTHTEARPARTLPPAGGRGSLPEHREYRVMRI